MLYPVEGRVKGGAATAAHLKLDFFAALEHLRLTVDRGVTVDNNH